MTGKILGAAILLVAAVAGGALYYLQVYGYYREVADTPGVAVALTVAGSETVEPIAYDGFRAVDADSSPIRFRACFATPETPQRLAARYVALGFVAPRNAPGWFDCFDAPAIAAALEAGTAQAFLGQRNIRHGVDRIVVVTDTGQGFIWHELNDCGEKAYDGTVVGAACPPRPDAQGSD